MATNIIGAGGSQVGRYFTVVSGLPASLFVLYVYLLVSADPWSGPLRWADFGDFQVRNLVVAGVAALTLALALNPLQRTVIQLLEGYWGSSRFAVALGLIRTNYHRRRMAELEMNVGVVDDPSDSAANICAQVLSAESLRERGSYPPEKHYVLPTRLGNVLRRYEILVGWGYGLDPLLTIPRLAMVGEEREIAYVRDQRVQLELATRTAVLSALAVPTTLMILVGQGLWMLLAVVPYVVAFLAYRGAVVLAHEYGTSMAVLTDLSRFTLYERLHLKAPGDGAEERDANAELMKAFQFDRASLKYEHPDPPAVGCDRAVRPAPSAEQ